MSEGGLGAGPAPKIPAAKVRPMFNDDGTRKRFCDHGPQSHHPGCRHDPAVRAAQPPLEGFPKPEGMITARQALEAADRPTYGPERPKRLRPNPAGRRAHFDQGSADSLAWWNL